MHAELQAQVADAIQHPDTAEGSVVVLSMLVEATQLICHQMLPGKGTSPRTSKRNNSVKEQEVPPGLAAFVDGLGVKLASVVAVADGTRNAVAAVIGTQRVHGRPVVISLRRKPDEDPH